jgi:hypothetical protein
MSKWQALSDILQVLHLLNNKEPCYYHSSSFWLSLCM